MTRLARIFINAVVRSIGWTLGKIMMGRWDMQSNAP
jgi:hypothetical protein